ncbi:MAG: class I SAM-dependent methyltransferase [Elusimicrobiales bacterium]|nr:class I SAM-dependent methyltransferase [Elusimicrobiales bacterium]
MKTYYNIKIFEDNIDEYDLWYKKNNHIFKKEIKAIKKLIKDEKIKRSVEIGCGSGMFCKALNIIEAIEPSKKLSKTANDRGIKVIKAFGEKIPYKDNTFDAAFILFTIEFVFNPLKIIKQVYRILKRGGIIIIGFINKDSIRLEEKKKNKFYKKAQFFNFHDISNLLKENSFKLVDYNGLIIQNKKVFITKDINLSYVLFIKAKKCLKLYNNIR